MLVRSGTTFTMYFDNVSVGNQTNSAFDAIDHSGVFRFGGRTDNNADRYFGGDLAEWAKWDVAFDAGQRAALTAGYSPAFFPNARTWYVPMLRDFVEIDNNIAITNNNGVTVVAHPPMIYPASQIMPFAPVVAAPAGFFGHGMLLSEHRNRLVI